MAGTTIRFTCHKPECFHLSFPTFKRFLNHSRDNHSHEPEFKINCPIQSCFRSYTIVSSLTSHVSRKHSIASLGVTVNDVNLNEPERDLPKEAFPTAVENTKQTDKSFSPRHLALFALKTQEINRLTDTTTNNIISNTADLLEQHEAHVKEKIRSCLEKSGLNMNNIEGLQDIMNSQQTPSMDILKTTKSRNRYLWQNFNLLDPIEIVLGEQYIHDESVGNKPVKVKTHAFQYIPPIKVLEQLLNQVDVLSEIENFHKSTDGKMRDICDGDEFNHGKHPLFSANFKAIQIMLYYDDFEVANPLGAKAVIHKIGGFYWVLGNLHPKYRSSLKNLNLVILCPVKWIKKYGMDKILRPFMNDLALLESDHGVQVKIVNKVVSIQGSLTVVLADNLGSNLIGGFMESFSALRPCRFCMGINCEFQEKFVEEEFVMRSRGNYQQHLELVACDPESASVYGVKKQSALNSSKFFHAVDGLPSDIMHDILEGVLPLHLKVMLRKFIMVDKLFTLKQFNEKLSNLTIGACDIRNKPSLIKNITLGDYHLRQSASQMWCLSRLLPFVVHQWVPEGHADWELFCDLMSIVDILFAPVIQKGTTTYLRLTISEYLAGFRSLYPNVNLIPKQHFMVHYPNQIRRYGPLVRNWCMRFEAKHHYFKLLAATVGCFKNITKTLAMRHQRLQCYWLSNSEYLKSDTEVGPGKVLNLKDLPDEECSALNETCSNLTLDSILTWIAWVKMYGDKYTKNMIIVYQQFIFPEFLIIHGVYILPNTDVVFCCKRLQTVAFNKHLHSYEIEILNEYVVVFHSTLIDHHPLDLYTVVVNGTTKMFVRLKYDLSDTEQ